MMMTMLMMMMMELGLGSSEAHQLDFILVEYISIYVSTAESTQNEVASDVCHTTS